MLFFSDHSVSGPPGSGCEGSSVCGVLSAAEAESSTHRSLPHQVYLPRGSAGAEQRVRQRQIRHPASGPQQDLSAKGYENFYSTPVNTNTVSSPDQK